MSSKYDVVKLKVHLSTAHYYILSRFLLSKMLMFCRIPEDAAVRISLDVKKHFVNCEKTSITQEELEAYLEEAIIAYGFSEAHTHLFPVVTQFHTERIPLVLLIAGPAYRGKTTLAHLLSERVNCSTIINTEVLHDMTVSIDELLLRLPNKRGESDNSKSRDINSGSVAPTAGAETEVVAAVNAEVEKAVREGKVVIVEGERMRLAFFRRFLDAAYQRLAGVVILGVVLDSLERPAKEVNKEYNEEASRLQPVYSTACVSVMASGSCNPGGTVPTVFVGRCHDVGDTLELAAFLHDVVIQRIIGELRHRGKLLPCEATSEASRTAAQVGTGA